MSSLRRVLIVQPYGIGDLLFITPVLRALRLIPTVERVDLLLGSRTDILIRSNPHVDDLEVVNKDLFHRRSPLENAKEILKLGKKLKGRRYDLLLDYSLRGEYAFFSQFFLGIPKRAGFNYKRRGFFHTHRLALPNGFAGEHVVDYVCDLAELAGIPVEDRFLEYYPEGDTRQEAQGILRSKLGGSQERFLVVSPGGGESWGKDAHFKRWPARFFGEFIERLSRPLGIRHAVILGSAGERGLAEELKKNCSISCVNLAAETSLAISAAILEKASYFVGNDGGLLHIAHALRIPVIGFYGPVDPVVYGPYPASDDAVAIVKEDLACRPCYQKFRYQSDCPHRDCLQALTPEEAFQFLRKKGFLKGVLQPS